MHRYRFLLAWAALCAVLALAGCSSAWDLSLSAPLALSGVYTSTGRVGALGTLALQLQQRPDTRVYDAHLTSLDSTEFGASDGLGTLGNLHLVLDFDRGKSSDFYFEGMVQLDGEAVTGIAGQFVFADQHETLPVTFSLR